MNCRWNRQDRTLSIRFEVDHTRLKLVSSIVLMVGKKLRMSKVGRQKLAELGNA